MSAHHLHEPPILGTCGSILAALGMSATVRETVHSLAGLAADALGFFISILTLCYWSLMLWDKLRARQKKSEKT